MKPLVSVVLAGLVIVAPLARASNDSLVTAVFSKVSNGYHRQKQADGSFKREYYAIGRGTYVPGVSSDRSIDAVRFPQVAKLVAQFLAVQNYYFAEKPHDPEMVLEITWGRTTPFNDSVSRTQTDAFFSAANSYKAARTAATNSPRTNDGIQSTASALADAARDEFEGELFQMQVSQDAKRKAVEHNARVLGYVEEINYRDNPSRFAGAGTAFDDLVSDVESERYYVIISAYDYRAAADGKTKPLWVTRVSVQKQGNKFNETLAAMLAQASRYFGQDSGRLVRQYQPEGKIKLGELKILGMSSGADSTDETPATKH